MGTVILEKRLIKLAPFSYYAITLRIYILKTILIYNYIEVVYYLVIL